MHRLTASSSSQEIHLPCTLAQPLEVKTVGAMSHAAVWKGRQAPQLVGMLFSQPVRSCSEPLLSWWDTESVLYCMCLARPAALPFVHNQYTLRLSPQLDCGDAASEYQQIVPIKLICLQIGNSLKMGQDLCYLSTLSDSGCEIQSIDY